MYQTFNPTTATLVEEFTYSTDEEVAEAVDLADREYKLWRSTPLEERRQVVKRAAEIFAERTEELAQIITMEMGKRIEESKGELQLVVDIFNYYADKGPSLLANENLEVENARAYIRKDSIGPILGIMPWNYPYYQVARLVAPNLLLGNTILLKHASNCPRSSTAIAEVLQEAGAPHGTYINLFAKPAQIETLLADERVRGVSLTGSEKAGATVAAIAGSHLKKVVLELGGSDPFIVLDVENMDDVVDQAVAARMGNNGQACNAPKRMIIMEDIYDAFVQRFAARMDAYEAGDPAHPDTTLPPLSSQAAADQFNEQVKDAVGKGASIVAGGKKIDHAGAFVAPVLLTGVAPGMHAYDDEIFGPAAVVFRVSSEDDAVALANDTKFGLGASVFSSDVARAERVAGRLDVGMVFINSAGGSQADLPFGGVKRSGVGRELGPLGIEEFMNKKVIRVPATNTAS